MTALPKYRSHKIVEAGKIVQIDWPRRTLRLYCDPDFIEVGVAEQWFNRNEPVLGGYFVRYDDGYTSYSPAKAFEDGYSRLTDEA